MNRKYVIAWAALAALTSARVCRAADDVSYIGPNVGDWNNASNWEVTIGADVGAMRVPQSGDDASVTSDSTHYLSGVTVNLDSDASVMDLFLNGATGQEIDFDQSANNMTVSRSLEIGNAVEYNQSGGTVTVQGASTGADFQISGTGVYDQTGGTFNAASMEVGNEFDLGSGATLNATSLSLSGSLNVNSGATLNIGTITGAGEVNYQSSASLSSGTISTGITTSANTTITKTTSGTVYITGTQSYGANTTYEADSGTTYFETPVGTSFASATLTIHANTTPIHFNRGAGVVRPTYPQGLTMNTPGEAILDAGSGVVVGTDSLSIDVADGGSMDVNDNTFILHDDDNDHNAAAMAQLSGYLSVGFNGGAWNGLGIKSSVAASTFGHSLGLLNNDDGSGNAIYTTWQTASVDADCVIVQYTYAGDANLDGTLSSSDFTAWLNGFQNGGTTWAQGDFNYDGSVDIANDFKQLAQGWYADYGNDMALENLVNSSSLTGPQQMQADAIIASVPEPGCGVIVAGGCAGVGDAKAAAGRERAFHVANGTRT